MEIHILRDGKQIGPFTEETVQSLLKQGSILINDLAWSPGLDGWSPLHAVLYPAAQPPPVPANAVPPPMPPPADLPESVERPAIAEPLSAPAPTPALAAKPEAEELATQRQKAFLTYMAVPFSSDLSKDRAAHLVNDAMENPKNSGKLKRWDEERLRLYPDLFADEIKARRENRSQQFYEICQAEGAEFFEGVTKAHTQVLVGYLDVQYPTWDQSERSAKYDYFFPAISEKFPQLVKRTAKGRFKYPDGPKVAAEIVRGPVSGRAKPRKSPLKAIVRGIFIGGILLGAVVGAAELKQRGGMDAIKAAIAKATERAKTASAKPAPGKPASAPEHSASSGSSASTTPVSPSIPAAAPGEIPPPPPPPVIAQTNPAQSPTLASAPVPGVQPSAAAPAAPADAAMAANTAPPPALPANVSLFDTTPPPAVPPAADPLTPGATTPTAPAPAAAAPPRVIAKITKPTVINLRFGTSTLRPGTPVQVLSSSGASLTIKFGPDTATVPVANTDYGTNGSTLTAPAGP